MRVKDLKKLLEPVNVAPAHGVFQIRDVYPRVRIARMVG